MAGLQSVRQWFERSRRWQAPLVGLSVLAVIALLIMPRIWSSTPDDESVVAEWNDAIYRLGIDPVFPPEEDIYVGDVFAVISGDNRINISHTSLEPLLNRAIKLDHIDMREFLISTYATLPIFPETGGRPSSASEAWPQKNNEKGAFAEHQARGVLPIAAFPGFTIRHERAVSGGLSSWVGGLFYAKRQDSDLLEVRIPSAETYGVPSLLADGLLARFCNDPFRPNVCSETSLRKQLSFVNPLVLQLEQDAQGHQHYVVDVEVALVNRVYLTRSIEQTRSMNYDSNAKLKAVAAVTAETSPSIKEAPNGLAAATPHGVLSVLSTSGSQYELKQTFLRPIVIGYRAVRYKIPENTAIIDETSKVKVK